ARPLLVNQNRPAPGLRSKRRSPRRPRLPTRRPRPTLVVERPQPSRLPPGPASVAARLQRETSYRPRLRPVARPRSPDSAGTPPHAPPCRPPPPRDTRHSAAVPKQARSLSLRAPSPRSCPALHRVGAQGHARALEKRADTLAHRLARASNDGRHLVYGQLVHAA